MILYTKKNILTGTAIFVSAVASAQEAAAVAAPVVANTSPDNTLVYLLIGACLVLLGAVLLLGNLLLTLTQMVIKKRALKGAAVLLLLFLSSSLFAQDAGAVKVAESAFKLPISMSLLLGSIVFITELAVVIWMLLKLRSLLGELSDAKLEAKKLSVQLPKIFDNLNASVAVEKEADIMLDHNYDGIRELDNELPPWWVYSFYLSIIWAALYLGYYFLGGGPSSLDEYHAEVEQAKIEVDAFNKLNALNVDESNVKLADAAGILEGKEIYKTNCVACHGGLGEGGVGPNLTDNYWLHGNSLNEVFKTVKYGWPAKGMKSWQSDLSAVQIKNVVGYIHTLSGTNPPNGKEPQGDLVGSVSTDSTAVAVVDSVKK